MTKDPIPGTRGRHPKACSLGAFPRACLGGAESVRTAFSSRGPPVTCAKYCTDLRHLHIRPKGLDETRLSKLRAPNTGLCHCSLPLPLSPISPFAILALTSDFPARIELHNTSDRPHSMSYIIVTNSLVSERVPCTV